MFLSDEHSDRAMTELFSLNHVIQELHNTLKEIIPHNTSEKILKLVKFLNNYTQFIIADNRNKNNSHPWLIQYKKPKISINKSSVNTKISKDATNTTICFPWTYTKSSWSNSVIYKKH